MSFLCDIFLLKEEGVLFLFFKWGDFYMESGLAVVSTNKSRSAFSVGIKQT